MTAPRPATSPRRRSTGALEHRESPPSLWRVLVDAEGSGPTNMAADHAVARALRPGEGVLRFYGWARPTVSFGRNEPARGLYDPGAAEREGVRFVRRPTGGRAVLHDDELTYAVAAPLRAWGGLRDAYRAINRGLVRGLRDLGVRAELAGPSEVGELPLSAGPCFQRPSEGEVVAEGGKLVGSAQARIGKSLLQHGSLILGGSQDPLARIGPEAAAEAGAPPTSVVGLLGRRPSVGDLVEALVTGLEAELGGRWERDRSRPEERRAERELEGRYRSPEWTWRR